MLPASLITATLLTLGTVARAQTEGGPAYQVPVVTITAPDQSAHESGDPGRFRLFRSGSTNLSLNVFLNYSGSAENGVDYAPLPTLVVIPAGIREVSLEVRPIDDTLVEGPEEVVARLAEWPFLAPQTYLIGFPSNAVVTIHDNDPAPQQPPVVTLRATDPFATEPGPNTTASGSGIDRGVFVVSRAGNTNHALQVFYSVRGTASNGVDYAPIPNSVIIPAGHYAAEVVITPLADALTEGTETVLLHLDNSACIAIIPPPPGCYQVGLPREAVVYIADRPAHENRAPEVKLTRPFDGQTFVTPANVALRAVTVDPDGYVDHIEFYANTVKIGEETRNYFVPPPPGERAVFEMVWTNPPVGRHVLTARAKDDQGATALSLPVTIWVVETNRPPITNHHTVVTITAVDAIASEGTNCWRWAGWTNPIPAHLAGPNTATFVVRRDGPTNAALTVYYRIEGTASNGVDYIALPGFVEIPAGRRAAEIRVVPIDDDEPERLESVVLGLRVPPSLTSAVPPYWVGNPGRAAVAIVDNDAPRPSSRMLVDHCFHFTKPGDNGTWWRIECSTNMVHWQVICTNQVTDGALHFVDPEAEDFPNRFYRSVPAAAPEE